MSRLLSIKITIAALAICFLISGCLPAGESKKSVTIAEQYGLAYLPLQVVKELSLIEKKLPGTEVKWKQLGNTAAIREAMLASEVDAGFMAIPPFLIGWDKGMDWKIACGLSSCPVALVTDRPEILSLADLSDTDRIALPQPGSVQHILLSMACEKEFGDSHRLDSQLVTMAHPDGMNALIAGDEITAHFTSPPYLFKELEYEGMHKILDGRDALGGSFTFIIGVTTRDFHDKNPDLHKAFIESVKEALDFVKSNPEKTAKMLYDVYDIPEAELLQYITREGMDYSNSIQGIKEFADFMEKSDYISAVPAGRQDILWDETEYEN